MPVFEDFYFSSRTGRHKIHGLKCTPDRRPEAVIQISHSLSEYIGRYRPFMEFLASSGFLVVGHDLPGHGKSFLDIRDRLFFGEQDGWFRAADDLEFLHDRLHADYPGLPWVLFGHGMGAALAETGMILHPDKYEAAILSGSSHPSRPVLLGRLAAAEMQVRLQGCRASGSRLNELVFGGCNRQIENPATPYDWLSRDPAVPAAYAADPFCGAVPTAGLFRDWMQGLLFVTSAENIQKISREKPVFLLSGRADPAGEYGRGVERAYRAFCRAGLHDVLMRLYTGGRHEMLNETCREAVYQDILSWIREKTGS